MLVDYLTIRKKVEYPFEVRSYNEVVNFEKILSRDQEVSSCSLCPKENVPETFRSICPDEICHCQNR